MMTVPSAHWSSVRVLRMQRKTSSDSTSGSASTTSGLNRLCHRFTWTSQILLSNTNWIVWMWRRARKFNKLTRTASPNDSRFPSTSSINWEPRSSSTLWLGTTWTVEKLPSLTRAARSWFWSCQKHWTLQLRILRSASSPSRDASSSSKDHL